VIKKHEFVEASPRRNDCCNVAVCFGRGWASPAIDLLERPTRIGDAEDTDNPVLGLHQREDSSGNADAAWRARSSLFRRHTENADAVDTMAWPAIFSARAV